MNFSTSSPKTDESEVRALYQQLLESWNKRNTDAMADPFAEDGEIIGFDGSHYMGREEIVSNLKQIFADHPTGIFVGKVRTVRLLGTEVALIRAVAGMIPHGGSQSKTQYASHTRRNKARRQVAHLPLSKYTSSVSWKTGVG